MTLGCEAGGYDEDGHQVSGYLEICSRFPVSLNFYEELLAKFSDWIDDKLTGVPVERYLNFSWSRFSYSEERYQGVKLVCFFRGCGNDLVQASVDASNAIWSFVTFLSETDQPPSLAGINRGSSQ